MYSGVYIDTECPRVLDPQNRKEYEKAENTSLSIKCISICTFHRTI